MIYRLKDHGRQRELDAVSGGTFSKGLRRAVYDAKRNSTSGNTNKSERFFSASGKIEYEILS